MADLTPFTESNALLALIRGDDGEARVIVRDMLENERYALMAACDRLSEMCRRMNR